MSKAGGINDKTRGKTVLLLGGDSPEREVSFMSGEMVLPALRRIDENTIPFDPSETPLLALADMNVSRVFNVLHGGAGENGEVQGALKMLGIPATGSGVLGSALAMDKHRAKLVWRSVGIPTPEWQTASSPEDVQRVIKEMSFPLFVKPSCGGSTTNATIVKEASELATAVATAASEGPPALVEEFIEGREYTASIVSEQPLPLIGIEPASGLYDYYAKYIADDTRFNCPCGLPAEQEKKLQSESMRAFSVLGCRDWGRVDFILTDDGPMFLEVNTVPGMTSHSLVPAAAKTAGMDYDQLIKVILEAAE